MNRERGFSLIEVIVGAAIILVAVVLVANVLIAGARSAPHFREQRAVGEVLQNIAMRYRAATMYDKTAIDQLNAAGSQTLTVPAPLPSMSPFAVTLTPNGTSLQITVQGPTLAARATTNLVYEAPKPGSTIDGAQ